VPAVKLLERRSLDDWLALNLIEFFKSISMIFALLPIIVAVYLKSSQDAGFPSGKQIEILVHITAVNSNKWIAKNCGHGRDLVRQVGSTPDSEPSYGSIDSSRRSAPLQRSLLMARSESTNSLHRIARCHPRPMLKSSARRPGWRGYRTRVSTGCVINPVTNSYSRSRLDESLVVFAIAHTTSDLSRTVFTDDPRH
jgi:hypothetical protein